MSDETTCVQRCDNGRVAWWRLGCALLAVGLVGCSVDPESADTYVVLEAQKQERLPLAPHVLALRARPSVAVVKENTGLPMAFSLLDKRTLVVKRLEVRVGDRHEGPWGGWLEIVAFMSDLLLQDGMAVHGPEGHVNPAVWVSVTDPKEQVLHEGWFFSRDPAQTAWDHPRFDLTFLGPVVDEDNPEMERGKTKPPAPGGKKRPAPGT
ncbi:MAG: hypothetical protein HQL64_01270 [Magnetococcales bacterium]|nr:hypothetical protein [Magnetococcales bacterium]